jgi:aminopeptidase N
MVPLEVRRLQAFGDQIQIETTRDFNLSPIESTVDALDARCGQLRQANQASDEFIKFLSETQLRLATDDVDLVSVFEEARDAVGAAYEKWGLRDSAMNALQAGCDKAAVEAYAALLTQMAALHDKLNRLCWIIREQEADQDKTLPGEFSNADDLFRAMGV